MARAVNGHVAWRTTLALALVACTGATAPSGPLRLLFIGNSLTEAHELPGMVEALAARGGQLVPHMTAVVRGGYSLEDHWNDGTARQAIRGSQWDVVVLQQGPSALPESRVLLVEYTRRFDSLIHTANGTTGLYMVWPDSTRMTAFDSVALSYRAAATAVGGVLFPAGEAWQAAWRRDPTIALYSGDGFHPSEAGSYLVALVFYARLYRQSPVGLPSQLRLPSGATVTVSSTLATTLQRAAGEVTGF